jgi:hypothetical protein
MKLNAALRRLRPVAIKFALVIIAATLCAPVSARAQVTPPLPRSPRKTPPTPDSIRKADVPVVDSSFVRDSLLRVDSLRRQAALDSIPKQFPQIVASTVEGFASGNWVWDEEALLREGSITLGDLLRRIPGINALRSGGYAHPEAVTSFGLTRGRIQIEVDGYVLDPLTSSIYDIAGIETINLVGVRVERHLDMIKIKLTTAQPAGAKPYTRLEVATGQPDVNIFRALFMVPKVIVGPIAGAIDRVGTDGIGRREPANRLAGWAKWSWNGKTRGLQVEYRRTNLKREGTSPWPTDQSRQDIVLRARQQIMNGLTAELFGGHSTVREDRDTLSTSTTGESAADSTTALERKVWQYGARAAFNMSGFYATGTLRLRDATALPKQEIDASAGYDSRLLRVGGDLGQQSWKTGPSASTYDVHAEAGPIEGLGAFVELASGDRGAPIYGDSSGISVRELNVLSRRNATRFGATLNRFGINAGGALLQIKGRETGTAPFGLPFDTGFVVSGVQPAKGFEAWGRVGIFRNRLFADASYTYYTESPGWTSLPTRSWRIAGEAHLNPLASGHLEILARIENVYRGPMLAYGKRDFDPENIADELVSLPGNQIYNAYLQIRIIDVRIFLQSEDMLGKGRLDIPDRVIPGPRLYYGVKWQLFN